MTPPPAGGRGPLLLGMGWSPDQPGGLNRYFRALFEALDRLGAEPSAVVVGPASDAPDSVRVPAVAADPVPRRVRRYARAVPHEVDLVDAHFSLYSFVPLVLGRLRRTPAVIHFQGPWADESEAAGERSRL